MATNKQGGITSQPAQANLRPALFELAAAAEEYLEWKDQNWSSEIDRRKWQRLKDATRDAYTALGQK